MFQENKLLQVSEPLVRGPSYLNTIPREIRAVDNFNSFKQKIADKLRVLFENCEAHNNCLAHFGLQIIPLKAIILITDKNMLHRYIFQLLAFQCKLPGLLYFNTDTDTEVMV